MVKRIIGNPTTTPMAVPDWKQDNPNKADYIKNKPTKLSQFENDTGYLTEHQDISGKADKSDVENLSEQLRNNTDNIYLDINHLFQYKADIPCIETSKSTTYTFEFSRTNNSEMRLAEVSSISFTFGNGEYNADYISGLSFDSGATPTAIDYTDSGILNWVGTDCTNVDGLSIFQPSANTHYDIVFYFNGVQFIGLVNGFVPATGNEAV